MTDPLALAFLGTFESLRMGPTFARGRRDERAGHVRHLTISGSLVVAQVRGPDDPAAFRARIAVRGFGASEWARVEQDLAAEARFAADLLAGRMPPGIGEVFAAAGLSLVPLSLDEVAMDCTCERWPMPCVHLAATCYALARAFEEDPFGVFAWRGRPREELLMHLRDLRSAQAVQAMDQRGRAGRERAGNGGRDGGAPGGDRRMKADFPPPHQDPFPRAGISGTAGDGAGGTMAGDGEGYGADGGASVGGGAGYGGGGPSGDGLGYGAGGGAVGDGARDDADGGAGVGLGRGAGDGGDGQANGGAAGGSAGRGGAVGEADEGEFAGAGAGDLGDVAAFWGAGAPPPMVPTGARPGAVTRPDALLDQVDPPPLAHDGRPIADLLRPAYRALPER